MRFRCAVASSIAAPASPVCTAFAKVLTITYWEETCAAFRFAGQGGRRWLAKDLSTLLPPWTPPAIDPHQVLLWKGDQGRAFIISGLLERDALTALSRRAWLSVLGGAGVMAGTLLVAVLKLTDVIR